MYSPVKVDIPMRNHEQIRKRLGENKNSSLSVKINLMQPEGDETLLLTRGQIAKMERARLMGKRGMTIRMTPRQTRFNVRHEGGFLGMLIAALAAALPAIASAAASAAPAVLASVATGAISGAVAKAISGDGLYLSKNGEGAQVYPILFSLRLFFSRKTLCLAWQKIYPSPGTP